MKIGIFDTNKESLEYILDFYKNQLIFHKRGINKTEKCLKKIEEIKQTHKRVR